MLTKTLRFDVSEVKFDSEKNEGIFSGFASAWTKDADDEIVDKGAFRRTLGISGGKVPILWQHSKSDPVGVNLSGQETDRGLSVNGKIALGMTRGRDAFEWLKLCQETGGRAGLSIGFRATPNGTYVKDGIRHFKEVELLEYSIVTFPANQDAYVTGVKAEEFEAVFSEEQIDRLSDEQKDRLAAMLNKSDDEKPKILEKLHAAAKKQGIDVSDGKGSDMDERGIKDDDESGDSAPSFDETMAANEAKDMHENKRYTIEKSRHDCIDGIMCSGMAKGDKKLSISKAMHRYAEHVTDWHSKSMDSDCEPMKTEDGAVIEAKSVNQADIAKLSRKMNQARSHMKEGHALINAGHDCFTKSYKIISDVNRNYFRNDVNLPNPMGSGKSESDQVDVTKTSDPDIDHSLTDELESLLGFLSVPTQG